MSGFTFRPAARSETSLLIGLAGPSASGKTASSLLIARGLCGGDKGIFGIDTESGRMLHYSCAPGESPGPLRFNFQHLDLSAPFSPARYREAIETAVKAGARVVIVDSMSHCHEGEGGLLDAHEKELERMAGNDYQKRERVKFAAWIGPKREHNAFVNAILQVRCHLIFCFRAKDKLALIKRDGKTEPVHVGWTPICSDRFEYEMTTLLMLPPNARGVPDLDAPSTKIQAHHAPFFPPGQPITEKCGEQLASWARGGASAPAVASPATQSWSGIIGAVAGERSGGKDVTVIRGVDGTEFRTLDAALARKARDLEGQPVEMTFTVTSKGGKMVATIQGAR